jgi:hypothetical protein
MKGTDPATGKPMEMKEKSEILGKDSKRTTFSVTGPDGKEMSMGTIEYTRRKAAK